MKTHVLLLLLLSSSMPQLIGLRPIAATVGSPSFSFAAAGDHGARLNTTASLTRLSSSGANFYLALGDLSYSNTTSESAWCDYVKSKVGPTFPFELVSGGHESNGTDGLIDNFAACLPDRIGGITGVYAKEYYFDYPSVNPMARFILISPALNFTNGGFYSYRVGTSHYSWLSNTIDSARAAGTPWIIVGMHEVCLSAGLKPCEVGQDLLNLLIDKRVDLVLQAEDHNYQRSKQLTCGRAGWFASSCVANDGSTGVYFKGAGTVFIVSGTFGQGLNAVNAADPEAPYFAKITGNNTDPKGYGFVSYTVSSTRIDIQTSFAGTFADSFSIQTGTVPQPNLSWSPTNPALGQVVAFSGLAVGGNPPYSFAWSFGDGGTALGSTVSHVFVQAQIYTVTLTATDSSIGTGTSRNIIAVGSWNGAVSCSPTLTTLEGIAGNAPIQRITGNQTAKGADYSGGGFRLAGNLPYGSNPVAWPFSKRSTSPPCFATIAGTNVPAFVEVHNVTVGPVKTEDCEITNGFHSCDQTFNICNASLAPDCKLAYPDTMHKVHSEIDQAWNASGIAPTRPTQGALVDVQGFVNWDPEWVNASWHSYSGWELHPLTAWRITRPALTGRISITRSSTATGQSVIFNATASGGTTPYTFTWDLGDGSTVTGNPVTHSYPRGRYNVHLGIGDSVGSTASLAQNITVFPKSDFRFDWGDYDNNGIINILDVAQIAFCFDQNVNSSRWSSCMYWDLTLHGRVDIVDVATVAFMFDNSEPAPFPGQGQKPGVLDPGWAASCSTLDQPDQLYCENIRN